MPGQWQCDDTEKESVQYGMTNGEAIAIILCIYCMFQLPADSCTGTINAYAFHILYRLAVLVNKIATSAYSFCMPGAIF